ncbi:MAG: VWA domain-containing protein [Deltaproteobacteria bacterium]|nr:VWA domain-containing protein [Deltaproteobacteria bacterium]
MEKKKVTMVVVAMFLPIVFECASCAADAQRSSTDKPDRAGSAVYGQNGVIKGSNGSVSFEIKPQYSSVLANTKGELNVLLQLEGKTATIKRQPLDLAVVIDRSGSMTGDKIASVKAAALELLKKLDKDDQVTLISYSDNVSVHTRSTRMNPAGRKSLRNHILRIHSGGSTALGPATIQALSILSSKKHRAHVLRHVMLLSDGLANKGESSPAVLGNYTSLAFGNGVSLSTLGVGLDYNEDLMTHLADQGGGQYHFINDDTMIATVLDGELSGLMATVAREMNLKIKTAQGVTVKKVFGYPMSKKGGNIVKVGSIRAGQKRDIVVQLTIDPGVKPSLSIGEMKLRFKDVINDGAVAETTMEPRVGVSNDRLAIANSENTEVTVRVAEVESAKELEIAARSVDQGDFMGAEKIIDGTIHKLRKQAELTPSKQLDRQLSEMQQARSDIKKAKTSKRARKRYVKGKKSSAYKRGKSSQSFDSLMK